MPGDSIRDITRIVLHGFSGDNRKVEMVFDLNNHGSNIEIHSDQGGNKRVIITSGFDDMNVMFSSAADTIRTTSNVDTSVWESDTLDTFLDNFTVRQK